MNLCLSSYSIGNDMTNGTVVQVVDITACKVLSPVGFSCDCHMFSNSTCRPCPQGFFGDAVHSACLPCPAGVYKKNHLMQLRQTYLARVTRNLRHTIYCCSFLFTSTCFLACDRKTFWVLSDHLSDQGRGGFLGIRHLWATHFTTFTCALFFFFFFTVIFLIV